MTSRERLMIAFSCGTPDRIPVAPQGFGKIPRDSPIGHELVAKTDIIVYAGGGVDPFIGNSFQVETRSEGDLTITIYQSPSGDFKRVIKRTEVTSACIEFPCKTPEDVERLLSVPYIPPTKEQIHQAAQRFNAEKDWLGDEGVVLYGIGNAICFPAEWLSPMDFCWLWADAPDLMAEMVKVANERLLTFVDLLCKFGVDAFRIVGGEYASEQLGLKAYGQLVVEPDKELVSLMHHYGALAYFHNHGPIMRYLPMILEIGVDALDPLEAPPWGDCDMTEAKRLLKGKICIVGNLDDMEVLDKFPTEEIIKRGLNLVEQAGPDGFVLSGTASGTYGEHAARNFIALAEFLSEGSAA
ncbi:MAG: hypothetical protein NZ805_11210 [Armatimonadetes bacterium]|nr:hypothetical protein [Armatimonadota bacterium]MDW8029616.1 uroporphyrinogen decarboxylase family protein [Armatimonadota bacterium]